MMMLMVMMISLAQSSALKLTAACEHVNCGLRQIFFEMLKNFRQ